MTEVSDYERQLARLRHWNRVIIFGVAGLMLLIFFLLTGYAIWAGQKDNQQTKQILDYISASQAKGSQEAAISREGGDVIRCILNIPPVDRTQAQIDACYPGGNQAAWLQHRKEVLGD